MWWKGNTLGDGEAGSSPNFASRWSSASLHPLIFAKVAMIHAVFLATGQLSRFNGRVNRQVAYNSCGRAKGYESALACLRQTEWKAETFSQPWRCWHLVLTGQCPVFMPFGEHLSSEALMFYCEHSNKHMKTGLLNASSDEILYRRTVRSQALPFSAVFPSCLSFHLSLPQRHLFTPSLFPAWIPATVYCLAVSPSPPDPLQCREAHDAPSQFNWERLLGFFCPACPFCLKDGKSLKLPFISLQWALSPCFPGFSFVCFSSWNCLPKAKAQSDSFTFWLVVFFFFFFVYLT